MLKNVNSMVVFKEALELFKVTDSGKIGKAYEIALRAYVQPKSYRKGVTPAETWYGDMRMKAGKNWIKIEIKTACGELGTIDKNATTFSNNDIVPKADYIVYCPEVIENIPMEAQGFVFRRDEFLDMVLGFKGKRGGSMLRIKPPTNGDNKKISIQSFYSLSRKTANKDMANYIWDCCYNQPTAEEWLLDRA